jgi:hypothetical protein
MPNKVVLNVIKYIMNNSSHHALSIAYNYKCIEGTINTAFLGLQIDHYLNCKIRMDQTVPQLIGAFMQLGQCSKSATVTLNLFHLFLQYCKVWNNFLV